MTYGWHEACDGLVCHHQSLFDVSMIVSQLQECSNVLNNQLGEIGGNYGRKVLHSSVRATAKECATNNKKDETELEIEQNRNNSVKSGERANDSNDEVEDDDIAEKCEKLNEWSKPAKGR